MKLQLKFFVRPVLFLSQFLLFPAIYSDVIASQTANEPYHYFSEDRDLGMSALIDRIMLEDADVVCVCDVASAEQASDLSGALHRHYAYFSYLSSSTEPLENACSNGKLIASKYEVDQSEIQIYLEKIIEGTDERLSKSFKNADAKSMARDLFKQQAIIGQQHFHDVRYAENCLISYFRSSAFPHYNTDAQEKYKIFVVKSHKDRGGDHGRAGGEVSGGVEYKWGGRDGSEFSGYIRGEAHDGHGNHVEGRVEQNDRGEGKIGVHGGHKTED